MKNKRVTSFILFTGATIVLFLSGNVIDFPKVSGGGIAIVVAILILSLGAFLAIARMKAKKSSRRSL